jgi:hypothetical protein
VISAAETPGAIALKSAARPAAAAWATPPKVLITPQTVPSNPRNGAPLTAIYDINAADTRDNGGTLTVNNRQIVIDVRIADLGFKPATKDGVEVDGEGSFTVLALQPSSSGMTKLQLRKG